MEENDILMSYVWYLIVGNYQFCCQREMYIIFWNEMKLIKIKKTLQKALESHKETEHVGGHWKSNHDFCTCT